MKKPKRSRRKNAKGNSKSVKTVPVSTSTVEPAKVEANGRQVPPQSESTPPLTLNYAEQHLHLPAEINPEVIEVIESRAPGFTAKLANNYIWETRIRWMLNFLVIIFDFLAYIMGVLAPIAMVYVVMYYLFKIVQLDNAKQAEPIIKAIQGILIAGAVVYSYFRLKGWKPPK